VSFVGTTGLPLAVARNTRQEGVWCACSIERRGEARLHADHPSRNSSRSSPFPPFPQISAQTTRHPRHLVTEYTVATAVVTWSAQPGPSTASTARSCEEDWRWSSAGWRDDDLAQRLILPSWTRLEASPLLFGQYLPTYLPSCPSSMLSIHCIS